MANKNRGLRSIFGKIKRSNSGNLEDLPADGEFRRGGVRATAGARLGWNKGAAAEQRPIAEWDVDTVCQWLADMGLECYEEDARKWLAQGGGKELATASAVDIEKELNLKSALHRKKICLALGEADGSNKDEMLVMAGKLDVDWVRRIYSIFENCTYVLGYRSSVGWTTLGCPSTRICLELLDWTVECCTNSQWMIW